MRPAPRTARAPRQQRPAPSPRTGIRVDFTEAEQAEIQDTALLRMWRSKGIHVRAYLEGGVMRFERVAEVVAFPTRETSAPADPVLAAIESTRRRWQGYRERRVDVGAIREALQRAFLGRETCVMLVDGHPGVVRAFVATPSGWRSRYVSSADDVRALTSGGQA